MNMVNLGSHEGMRQHCVVIATNLQKTCCSEVASCEAGRTMAQHGGAGMF